MKVCGQDAGLFLALVIVEDHLIHGLVIGRSEGPLLHGRAVGYLHFHGSVSTVIQTFSETYRLVVFRECGAS